LPIIGSLGVYYETDCSNCSPNDKESLRSRGEPGITFQYLSTASIPASREGQAVGVEAGEYVQVTGVNREQNLLTVEGENGQQLTYDPDRLHGVSVYKSTICILTRCR
jgi:hypothetical protein